MTSATIWSAEYCKGAHPQRSPLMLGGTFICALPTPAGGLSWVGAVCLSAVRIRGRRIEVDAPYVGVFALGLNVVRVVTVGRRGRRPLRLVCWFTPSVTVGAGFRPRPASWFRTRRGRRPRRPGRAPRACGIIGRVRNLNIRAGVEPRPDGFCALFGRVRIVTTGGWSCTGGYRGPGSGRVSTRSRYPYSSP